MSRKSPAVAKPASYEEAVAELKQLVSRMESGELTLDASLVAYQRGTALVKYCSAQLEKVESQVKILEGEMLRPFAENVTAEDD